MLGTVFAPRSVAVVGASDDRTKLRGRLLDLLVKGGFDGPIYPVNPSLTVVQGLAAYADLSSLPEVPDVALIAVPGARVPEVVAEAARLGVKGAVVYSSGVDLQALRQAIGASPIRLFGSNSEGFYFAHSNFAATFAPALQSYLEDRDQAAPVRPGSKISIVSQSGGMGFAIFGRLVREHVDIHAIVTTGNEDIIDCLDVLEQLVDDGHSGVIVLFIEGLQGARRLGPIADKARAKGIAIVALKVGTSVAGQRAALSHTAHLAGSDTAYDAVLKRHGIIRVLDQESLLAVVPALARLPRPQGRRLAIVTTSGGAGTWAADQCEAAGFVVPELSERLQDNLLGLLPGFASAGNPVDVTGQAVEDGGAALVKVVECLTASDEVDAILVNMGMGNAARIHGLGDGLGRLAAGTAKPVLYHSHIHPAEDALRALADLGCVGVRSLRGAGMALGALAQLAEFQPVGGDVTKANPMLRGKTGVLGDTEIGEFLRAYAVPLPLSELARTRAEAETAAAAIGGLVALKIQSGDLQHKTEAGGVVLGLSGENVGQAFDQVMSSARAYAPDAVIDGVLVQQMIPQGTELIVGMHDDPDFGPMLMVGAGGIHAEIVRDVVFSPAPIDREEALRMISCLRIAPILAGARGQPVGDVPALADLLVAVGRMAVIEFAHLRQFDLNPVIVLPEGDGVVAVDALIIAGPCAGQGD